MGAPTTASQAAVAVGGPAPAEAPAAGPEAALPLSLSQREVWLDQRAWPGSPHLNMGGAGYLLGPLEHGLMLRALQALVDESESLRLVPQPDGRQRLLPAWTAELEVQDLSALAEPEAAMHAGWQRRMATAFELGERPPWRFLLTKLDHEVHTIFVQFHHLVMDGWGSTQLMRRWGELCGALQQGRPATPVDAGWRSCIEDSLAYRQSPAFARDAAFWARQFAGQEQALRPLLERRRGAMPAPGQLSPAHLLRLNLPRADFERCSAQLAAQGHTVTGALLAALSVYYWRCLGRSRLLVALPSLNRPGARLKALPGMLVGLIALPLQCQPEEPGSALLAQMSHLMQVVLRHSRYPFSELAQGLQLMRHGRQGLDSAPDLLLSVGRQDFELPFGSARLRQSRQMFTGLARYGLALSLCEFGSAADPELAVEASAACFEADELPLLARRLWHLVAQLAEAPAQPLEQLQLMPPEERFALIEGLHQGRAKRAEPPTFIAGFEHQAALQAESLALVWDEGQLSYGQLDAAAARLASRIAPLLQQQPQPPGTEALVALALPRGWQQVAAVLACAKCGVGFLPLDVEAPAARLALLLADSAAAVLLCGRDTPQALLQLPVATLHIEDLPEACSPPEPGALLLGSAPRQLAYVLYTSGSTGQPKGVRVSHLALSRRLAWLAQAWVIVPGDRAVQSTQLVFDPSLIELLLPLSQGASVALPPPGRMHPERLAEFVLRHGASFCALVPTTLAGLLEGLQSQPRLRERLRLRVACCGGEVLAPELAQRFQALTGALLYNLYGPTEATIFASAWPCTEGSAGLQRLARLPLGQPVDDTRIYVLDERLRPLPFGVTGEICIGGEALAEGYLHHPELDRQRFLPDPFQPGQRLYRSGDRGWLDPGGLLHFAGRLDRQIKLRGYRIELGDVEAACLALPGVIQAHAQRIEEIPGAPRLHAWLALPGLRQHPSELLAALRGKLPDYMVPGSLSLLTELPLLPNGKIDVQALPRPEAPLAAMPSAPGAERAPTALEQALRSLWQQHLPGHPEPGLNDDFFALGGDSLAALAILSALEQQQGRPLSLALLSEHPSIAALALALTRAQAPPGLLQRLSGGRTEDAPAAASDQAPRLFLAASGHGDAMRFQALARALRGQVALFMLQPPRQREVGTIAELAEFYADAVQVQGGDTGWLAGFSVGGVTALETARLLRQRGQPPRGLLLLDTIHPDAALGGGTSWRACRWLVRRLHIQELSMNGRRLGAMFNDPGLVAQVMALRQHRCQPFEGPTLLLKSSGLLTWERMLFRRWRRLLGPAGLQERVVNGLHGSIFEPAHVQGLAEALSQTIHQATKQAVQPRNGS